MKRILLIAGLTLGSVSAHADICTGLMCNHEEQMSEYSNHKLDNYDMLKWYKHIEHENDLLEAMSRGETKDKGIHIEGLTTSNGIPI